MGIVGATTDTFILFENGVRRNRLVLPGLSNAADHMPSKPDPPAAPLVEQAGKATWRGGSVNIGSPAALAPRAVHDNDPLLPPRWGVRVAVELQVDETGELNPGVSFIEPLSDGQSRALGLGATLSSQGTREDKFGNYWNLDKHLLELIGFPISEVTPWACKRQIRVIETAQGPEGPSHPYAGALTSSSVPIN
jgi:hypothetical protein